MTQKVERMLPLYEAKMIHQFDHRWATYEPDGSFRDLSPDEKGDPSFTTSSVSVTSRTARTNALLSPHLFHVVRSGTISRLCWT